MKIAVVGSGISGLTSAYRLQHAGHDVTVFEARPRPGMLAHSPEFSFQSRTYTVDTLVLWERSYPQLVSLLRELGFSLVDRTIENTSVAQDGESRPYAAYRSTDVPLTKLNLPLPRARTPGRTIALCATWLRLLTRGWRVRGRLGPEVSVSDFFRKDRAEKYRRQVYPWVSGFLGFVDADVTGRAQMTAVIDYFGDAFRARPQCVAEGLTRLARHLLGEAVFRPGTKVFAVAPDANGVVLTAIHDGQTAVGRFDHVVLAVPPRAASALVSFWSGEERRFFDEFPQCEITLSVHTDTSLLPSGGEDRCALNYRLHRDPKKGVELTCWGNAPFEIHQREPVIFSWNAVRPPTPESVIYQEQLTRVLPTVDVQGGLRGLLPSLQGRDRIWLCGTWAVPDRAAYLEQGVSSAEWVASQISSV